MRLSRIIQLLEAGGCGNRSVSYLVIDNQLYSAGYLHNNRDVLIWASLLERIMRKVKLPDMFFLLHN